MKEQITVDEQFDSLLLDKQLCFPLYAAARRVVSLYTPFFKELGITYTQHLVFLVLWEEGCVSVGRLCERLYLDSGTLTPLIKKMEKGGYVRRQRSAEDERIVMIELTDEGRTMRQKVRDIPGKVGACVPLSETDALQLYCLLYKLLNGME